MANNGQVQPGAPAEVDDTVLGVEDGEDCAGVTHEAGSKPAPVDIIWAIDNSGSMVFEAQAVQDNMNRFTDQIAAAGIDAHVAVISADGPPGFIPDPDVPIPGALDTLQGVCIPAPLGSGNCPEDTNMPGYMRVNFQVQSTDALMRLIEFYPEYKQVLRQKSIKYFAVVTDDESYLTAPEFTTMVEALDPGWLDSWKFFGVFCFDTACFGFPPPCDAAGNVYKELVDQTGGTAGSLCLGQMGFGPVFDALAETVIETTELACEWEIPPPPGDEVFRKERVNVQYTPGAGGAPEDIYWVETAADCGEKGGWYYDDHEAPTKVQACPSDCSRMKVDFTGKVDIRFGCLTIARPD